MANENYVRNVYGPQKLCDLSLVLIQANIGASGAVTVDAAQSSPGVTCTLSTTGQYAITFPKCETVQLMGAHSLLAEAVGSAIYFESLSGTAGTGAFETAVNTASDTAAEPASGTRFFITLLCGGA